MIFFGNYVSKQFASYNKQQFVKHQRGIESIPVETEFHYIELKHGKKCNRDNCNTTSWSEILIKVPNVE